MVEDLEGLAMSCCTSGGMVGYGSENERTSKTAIA